MALREILAKFGYETDDSKLVAASKQVDGFATRLNTLAEKVLGGTVQDAFKEWVSDVKESVGEFRGLAKMTGTSNEEMQRWTTAAKLGGSSTEALAAGFRVLQKNAAAAADGLGGSAEGMVDTADGALEAVLGSKAASEAFKALGVDVKDSSGEMKSATQLMGDVGLEIAKIKSPVERAAVATKLFGRRGTELLPIFAKGEKGLSQLLDKIDELGGGVSEEAIKALAEQGKASKEWDVALLSLKSTVVTQLLPAMTAKIKAFSAVLGYFNRLSKGTNIVKAGLITLGGAMLILKAESIAAGIKTALAWAPTIITFAAIALLLDDLISLFQGGDSAAGRLIDQIFGIGSAKKAVETIKDLFGSLTETLSGLGVTGPKAIAAIAIALVALQLAASPVIASILAVGAAVEAVTAAVHRFQDLDKKSKGHGLEYWWVNAKRNLGITSREEYLKQRGELTGESERDINVEGMSPAERASLEAWEHRSAATAAATYAPEGYSPSAAYAPSAPGGGNEGNVFNIDIKNTNHFDTKVTASGDGSSVADAVRDGQNQSLNDDRNATLSALESIAP